MTEAEVACGEFVIAGGASANVEKLAEVILDTMTQSKRVFRIWMTIRLASVAARRGHRFDVGTRQRVVYAIGVVGLVCVCRGDLSVVSDMLDGAFEDGRVMAVAGFSFWLKRTFPN